MKTLAAEYQRGAGDGGIRARLSLRCNYAGIRCALRQADVFSSQ